MRTNREQQWRALVASLERQIEERDKAIKRERSWRIAAEVRAEEAEAAAEDRAYVVVDDDRYWVTLAGKRDAETAARDHFYATGKRTRVFDRDNDVIWDSRLHGGHRRPKAA